MSRVKLWSKYLPLLACLAVLVVYWGCAEQSSLISVDGPKAGDVILHPSFVQFLTSSKGDPEPLDLGRGRGGGGGGGEASGVISAELGGVLTNGVVSLAFPPGALAEDTNIHINPDNSELLIVDLSPDGLVFLEPVTISVDLTGTTSEGDAKNTYIAWLNPDTGQWELIEMLSPKGKNTTRGLLHHFSKFGEVGG